MMCSRLEIESVVELKAVDHRTLRRPMKAGPDLPLMHRQRRTLFPGPRPAALHFKEARRSG
eukprot:m.36534 g.36534  ORF g.36534 m.36534 type:complete len:61 (+) comp12864_c0_seq2:2896-3078(+)